jgi:hypothetical protein
VAAQLLERPRHGRHDKGDEEDDERLFLLTPPRRSTGWLRHIYLL